MHLHCVRNVMAHAHKPDFVLQNNGRVHSNRQGASVQLTTGNRGVRISGSNAGYTTFRGSVKGTGYPLQSPVSPSLHLPFVTVCHCISTELYIASSFLTRCKWILQNSSFNFCFLQYKDLISWLSLYLVANYRTRKIPPLVPILSQINLIHFPSTYSLNIHFNIILPYIHGFYAWSPSLWSPHQDRVCSFDHPPYVPHAPPTFFVSIRLPNNIVWGVQIIKLLIM